MTGRTFQWILGASLALAAAAILAENADRSSWQQEFPSISTCKLQSSGKNSYFVLEPGYQLVLEGGGTKLEITVLDQTKTVDGVATRVVEEKEWKGGKLHEVARNYFSICEQTKDVYYFGEEVDFYENGKVTKHDGTWLAGVNDNKPGLFMPGTPKVNMKYYQELAPSVAMDRAEIVSLTETCKTPAGTFSACLKVKEGSAIDLLANEVKYHAPGVGLVNDGELQLTKYGYLKK